MGIALNYPNAIIESIGEAIIKNSVKAPPLNTVVFIHDCLALKDSFFIILVEFC